MMKATILCGSADMHGVTESMCTKVASSLESRGYDVVIYRLGEMDIGHCRDCGGCREGGCVINDDMQKIYDSFSESDILVLSTPIHYSGPSSLIKTAIDRFQIYWQKDLSHPSSCIGMMCGGSDNPNFDYTERIFRAFSISVRMEYRGSYTVSGTDRGCPDIAEGIEQFIGKITAGKGR